MPPAKSRRRLIDAEPLSGADEPRRQTACSDLVEPVSDDPPIVPVCEIGDDDRGAYRVLPIAAPSPIRITSASN